MVQFGDYTSRNGAKILEARSVETKSARRVEIRETDEGVDQLVGSGSSGSDSFVRTEANQKYNSQDILKELKNKGVDIFRAETIEDKKAAVPYLEKLVNSDAPDYMIDFYKSVLAKYREEINASGQSGEPPEIQQARTDLKSLQDKLNNIDSAIRYLDQQRYNGQITSEEYGRKRSAFEQEKQSVIRQINDLQAKISDYEKSQVQEDESPEDAEAAKIQEYREELKEREEAIKNLNKKIEEMAKSIGRPGGLTGQEFYEKAQQLGLLIQENTKRCEELRRLISDYEAKHNVPLTNTFETKIETLSDGSKVETTVEKDPTGNVVSEKSVKYRTDGSKKSETNVKYAENGNKETEVTELFDKSGNVKHRRTQSYDENGYLKTKDQVSLDEDGNVTGRGLTEYERDEKGNELSSTVKNYNQDGTLVNSKTNQYERDNDGNIISQSETITWYSDSGAKQTEVTLVKDANDNVLSDKTAKYDKDGGRVEIITTYDLNHEVVSQDVRKYDKDGNDITKAKNTFETNTYTDEYGVTLKTTKEKDETGNVVSETRIETDENGNRITAYKVEYHANGKPKSEISIEYNPDGSRTEVVYEYDETGRIRAVVSTKYENGDPTPDSIPDVDATAGTNTDSGVGSDVGTNSDVDSGAGTNNNSGVTSSDHTIETKTENRPDGTKVEITIERDADGVMVYERDVQYDANNVILYDSTFELADGKSLIKAYKDGKLNYTIENTIERLPDGRIKETAVNKDGDGNVTGSQEYIRTVRGERTSDGDISHENIVKTEKDANGNVVRISESEITTYQNGNSEEVQVVKDADGNILSTFESRVQNNEDGSQISLTKEKDAEGNTVSEFVMSMNADGTSWAEVVDYYEDTTVNRITHFDANGNEISHNDVVENRSDGSKTTTLTQYERDAQGSITSVFLYKKVENADGSYTETMIEADANGKVVSEETKSYDKNGKEIKSTDDSSDVQPSTQTGETKFETKVETKDDGSKIETTTETAPDGHVVSVTKVAYDAKNNTTLEEKIEYNENGNIISKHSKNTFGVNFLSESNTTYEYDSQGNLVSEVSRDYDKDGNETGISNTKYERTADGRTIKTRKDYDSATNNLKFEQVYEIGPNNEITSKQITYKNGVIEHEYGEYTNDKGKKVSYSNEYKDGKLAKTTTIEQVPVIDQINTGIARVEEIVIYDENEKPIKKTINNLSSRSDHTVKDSSVEVYSYSENGNLKTSTQTNYDDKGKVTGEHSTFYDTAGNVIDATPTTNISQKTGYTIETKTGTYYDAFDRSHSTPLKVETITQKDYSGRVVAENIVHYDKDGNVKSYSLTEYRNGTKVKETNFEAKYGTTRSTVFDESSGTRLCETVEQRDPKTNKLISSTVREYYNSSDGGGIKNEVVTYYDQNGSLMSTTSKFYNPNGKAR